MEQFTGVEAALDQIEDSNLKSEVYRVLYGISKPHDTLEIPKQVVALSEQHNFEVKVRLLLVYLARKLI